MLDLAFRNIRRQRTRTILTVLGIMIGIAAVVGLGSVGEGLNVMMENNLELVAGKIMVMEAGLSFGSGMMNSEITDEDLADMESVTGVKDVVPMLFYMEAGIGEFFMGGDVWWAIGLEPEKMQYWTGENILYYDGREIEEGESEVAVLGKNVADNLQMEVGDSVTILDTEFDIVGILEKSEITDIDGGVMVPLDDLSDLLESEDYQFAFVIPEDLRETEKVAEGIEDVNEDLDAVTSTDMARQASQIIDQVRFFTIGIGAIAAVVGGLGVMNTMIMAIVERRREIGVLKAIGATNSAILKQFLQEAAAISLIGGFLGLLLGLGAAFIINIYTGFMISATVTPALAVGGMLFALGLGLLGGFYPAWKASRQDPVEALRYE
ncbi:MAG: ABC transporter permease [Candidatus Aenigmatarchaeota archaeon]